jgi:hypothetical protein
VPAGGPSISTLNAKSTQVPPEMAALGPGASANAAIDATIMIVLRRCDMKCLLLVIGRVRWRVQRHAARRVVHMTPWPRVSNGGLVQQATKCSKGKRKHARAGGEVL